jgi:hypothetical protein
MSSKTAVDDGDFSLIDRPKIEPVGQPPCPDRRTASPSHI